MTDKAISPLHQRMIEDMTARHFAEKTIAYDEEPCESGELNCAIVALRFSFKVTLERDDLVRRLTFVREPRKAIVLSPEEVARLLEAAPGVKYKAALSVAYGAGLRVSEVVALKVFDIDSQPMTLRVEQGKGDKDRREHDIAQLLELLRDWWRVRAHGPGCSLGSTRSTR